MSDNIKAKVLSISMEAELQDTLKNSAKKSGHSVSQLVRELVDKYLDLIVNDKNDIPVIVRIPGHLRYNQEELKKWLQVKVDAIVNALTETT